MSQGITIYANDNSVLYEMQPIFKDCKEKVTLMSEDYIELKFSLVDPIYIEVGAWCEWNGKRYYVIEHQQPTPNMNNGGFDYDIKFVAYYLAWQTRIYKATIVATSETTFNYTGNAKAQLDFFLECLKNEGLKYNGTDEYEGDVETYRSDEDILDEVKTLSFSENTFIDVLNQIASEWDTEWWVVKNKIYLGKCQEKGDSTISLELNKNVAQISASKSEQQYATRLYAFGSTQNLPHNWNRGDAEFSVKSLTTDKKGFKADRDLNTSYWSKKYVIQTYDYVRPIFKECSQEVSSQKNQIIIIEQSNKLQLKKGTYKKGTQVFYKKAEEDADDIVLSFTFTPNEAIDDAGFKPKNTYAKIVYSVFLRYNATPSNINEKATDDAVYYFKLNGEKNTLQEVHIKIKDFDIPEDKNDVWFDISVNIYFYSTYVPDTSGGISPLATNYTGTIKINSETEMRIRTSDYYNNVATSVAFLDADGNEKDAQNVTFTTKDNLFAFLFDILPNEPPKVGDKFHIKNIINSKLPSYYFPSNKQDQGVIKAMAETRLCMRGKGYIEANGDNNYLVEKAVTFDDVYPSVKTAITEVTSVKKNVLADDGITTTGEKYDEYRIKEERFVFDNDYKLPDVDNLQIVFQSGALSGLTFDTEFIAPTASASDNFGYFRVKRKQFDGGLYLPSSVLFPEVGDEFILQGWDVSRIEDSELIEDAQKRLEERARKELKNMNSDPSSYTCTLLSDVAYEEQIDLHLGQRVTLVSKAFFKDGKRESRVLGYEKNMDIICDSPQYTIAEKAKYSKFKELQKQIDNKQEKTANT